MRAVNESNPVHYAAHPVWKNLVYDDSCRNDIEAYRVGQASNLIEFNLSIFNRSIRFLFALYLFISNFRMASFKDFLKFVLMIFIGHQVMILTATSTHFTADISVLNGGMIHHAFHNAYVMGDTVGQGYVLNAFTCIGLYGYISYTIISKSKYLSKVFNPSMLVALTWIWVEAAVFVS